MLVGRLPGLVFVFCAVAGLVLNLYLLSQRYMDAGTGIAGCGGGGCEEILTSRWSLVFGIPVTAFGALAYLGLLFSLSPRGRGLHWPLLALLCGAAFWFVLVQAVILRKFCPWCLVAHGLAMALLLVGLGSGKVGPSSKLICIWIYSAFLCIGLMQLYGPVPASHRVEGSAMSVQQASLGPKGQGRTVSFDGGSRTFDVLSLPHIGSPDARQVMVEYFDYQCPSCRVMSGYLSALVEKHPADICVLLLPVPLDHRCNNSLPLENEGYPGSCELTRIALAVWRVDPNSYLLIHRAFLSEPAPNPSEAMALASEIVGTAKLEAAMMDPWIDERLQANIAGWAALSGKTNKLPKLLIRDKRILHGLPSGEQNFIRVMEQELGI